MKEYEIWSNKTVTEEWVNSTNDCDRMNAAFEDGYKAGFIAADNGDTDAFYELIKGETK